MTQQSRIKALMLTVLAILAFTGILWADEAKKRARGPLLRIIPSESLFCVRVNNLKTTLSSADDFLGGLVPLSYKLTSFLDGNVWKGVDTNGDLALFGMILPGDSPNTNPLADLFVGLLVQVPEYKKLISGNPDISKPDENGVSKVGGNGEYGLLITRIGKYALVSWRRDYDKLVKVKSIVGPRKPGLRTALDAKEIKRAAKEPIWAYANIQLVGKTFGPIVMDKLNKAKKMLEQMDKAHRGPIENYGMIMDMYAEILKVLADEVQYVTIAISPTTDVLNVSKTVVARDGTKLADAFVTTSRKKGQRNKLLAYLQNDAIMNFAGRINTPFLANIYVRSLDLLTCLDGGMSKEDIAKLKVMMVDQFAAMGENVAFSFLTQKDKPPFALRYVVEISNEKKFSKVLDEQIEMMNSGAFADIYRNLGFKMDMQVKRGVSKYEGVSIDSAKLTLRSTDPNSQQGKMIEAMYGDGFDYRWALVDGHAVYVVGGDVDTQIRTLIDKVKADGPKRPGTEMKSALALLKGRGRTDFVGTFNYVRLLNMVFSMMPQLPNGPEMPRIDMTSKSNLAFAGNLSKGKMTIRAALPKEHIKELVAFYGKMQNKRAESRKKARPTVQPRKDKATVREPQTSWHIVEIESKQTEPMAPTQLVPVKGGIWIGDYYLVQRRQPIAFFDFEKNGFTLLLQEGGKSWDAIGYVGLVVQHNRLGLVKLDARNQLATIWEEKPEGCKYFDYFEAHKGRFYLNSPYNPLWIYNLESRVWTNVELDYVRDADFARLRENYYKPILRRFVLGKNGDVWGFQGTRDARRGNAVCHFFPEKKAWEQFDFPWERSRGGEYWPIGVTHKAVWFLSGRNNVLLFDKNTHRWERLKAALPAGRTSPITFCEGSVLVAEGNQVCEFHEATSSWEPIRAGVIEGPITGITEKDGTLYVATGNGLYVNEDFKSLDSSPSLFFPWKILPEAKSYILTQSTSVHPSLIHVRTLCEAVERGAKKEVESLLKLGVDVNATTEPTGLTPLHLAASKGDKDMVELLLEHGANINTRNMSRLTPLRMAVRGGHIEVADFLMSKGGKK